MNPADILALIPAKPEYMPKISAITNKPTQASIKDFQKIIQDQAISITNCDHNLGFFGMVLRASDYHSEVTYVVVTGGDGHGLILNDFLENFDACLSWFVCYCCNLGHVFWFDRDKS